jgi:ABC-type multidrug transport system fused ATPase/permease subunit
MMQILASLIMITNIFNTFVRTKASNERILQVLRGEEDSGGNLRAFRDHFGRLSFRNATFRLSEQFGQPLNSIAGMFNSIQSALAGADRIFVIGDGRVLESGTHRELMERKGPYYRMVVSQTGQGASEPLPPG